MPPLLNNQQGQGKKNSPVVGVYAFSQLKRAGTTPPVGTPDDNTGAAFAVPQTSG